MLKFCYYTNMNKERTSSNHSDNDTRSHLTRRGVRVLTAITGLAGAGLITGAANSHPSEKTDNSPKVICEVPVRSGDTMSGLADDFQVGQSNVKVFHPNVTTPEKNPVDEMQPGDIAIARIGAAACYGIGGMPGDPTHPGVIIE